jgi:hypothetical protein
MRVPEGCPNVPQRLCSALARKGGRGKCGDQRKGTPKPDVRTSMPEPGNRCLRAPGPYCYARISHGWKSGQGVCEAPWPSNRPMMSTGMVVYGQQTVAKLCLGQSRGGGWPDSGPHANRSRGDTSMGATQMNQLLAFDGSAIASQYSCVLQLHY